MAQLNLPCPRCGRPIPVAAGAIPRPEQCPACSTPYRRYLVRSADGSRELDAAAVLDGIKHGKLSGLDWVSVDGGRAMLLASHPDFRAHFLEQAPTPVAVSRPVAPVLRQLGKWGLALLVVAAVSGGAWILWQRLGADVVGEIERKMSPLVEQISPGEAARPAPPEALAKVEAVARAVGPVEEPVALLLARAWAARATGDADSLALAAAQARRAVARDPRDPEALALLAEILSDRGEEAELRAALVAVLAAIQPEGAARWRAEAAVALAGGDAPAARAAVQSCLQAAADDLPCRFLELRLRTAAEGAAVLADFDRLAEAWPENRRVARSAALVAVAAGAPDAAARIAAQRKLFPADVDLVSADAVLAFGAFDFAKGRALVERAGAGASAEALVLAAAAAVSQGHAADAAKLAARAEDKATGHELRIRARRLRAQAAWLSGKELDVAVAALVELDKRSPVSVQVQVLRANRMKDGAAAGAAVASVEEGKDRVDLARVHLARGVGALERNELKDAATAFEAARSARPRDPEPWLGVAAAAALAGDVDAALGSLRRAVASVDGRGGDRVLGATLPVDVPAEALLARMEERLAGAPRDRDLAFARGAIALLAGRPFSPPAGPYGEVADAALAARGLLAARDYDGCARVLDGVAAAMAGDPVLLATRALLQLRRGADAREPVGKLVATDPQDPWYHRLRAQAARAAGDAPTALAAAEKALGLDPGDAEAASLLRRI